ncbi:DUF342 domain-containing protein [Vibrio viridaestus]|uniref:DUF342 domain-containing protein n=2 Tax=Pseudomonadati TaxID=3379134 RepID=A0A3N9TL11_9VIBR|nr:FapA family protein [Vibrio viridaestus]RQW65039.1 DUF342 domain-containing protein [Vibrio viridaestus]
MWKRILQLNDDKNKVTAIRPEDMSLDTRLSKDGITDMLRELGAEHFYLDHEALERFIKLSDEAKKESYSGVLIADRRNATVEYELVDKEMVANLILKGAYGGRGLRGSEILHALANGHITKGINKVALKKALVVSASLAPGEIFTQPVAQGLNPTNGKDAYCEPLVEDISQRVLAPQHKEGSEKLDMKNLGATITVGAGDPVMKKHPATKGSPGFTVTGKVLEPTPGKDIQLKIGKNTQISSLDLNTLEATISGLPIIKPGSVDVDNAMVLKSISVETGHVKFKGSVVVSGNIESGMIVKATGDIIVGGFVESADVQAQGDIQIAKGIIGHTVTDGDDLTCTVKSGKSITANYAQYAFLQAHDDIHLSVHSISNKILCGNDLIVLDENEKNGTLSGGTCKVGGKLVCFNLGVEGDTATFVEAFAKYPALKEKISFLKEQYDAAQNKTMDIVRSEIEYNKKKASEKSEEELRKIADEKEVANVAMLDAKTALAQASDELEGKLLTNIVDVKHHVYTHVTVQYGSDKILTKKEHGQTVFSYNQHEIQARATMVGDDIAKEQE